MIQGTPTTIDRAEAEKFAAMSESWWDSSGKFAPLHQLNPTRIAFIRDYLLQKRGMLDASPAPLAGLRLLDIGCGGGLLSEPMARLGAEVTGIDVIPKSITVARRHAETSGLSIDYRVASAEEMAAEGQKFNVVLAMEIIEHVADPSFFLTTTAQLLAPGGTLFLATLNRTAKAYLMAIIGAEYILRWLPRGTHDWNKFLKPSELSAPLRRAGLEIEKLIGVSYDPLRGYWRLSDDFDVNYMMVAKCPLP